MSSSTTLHPTQISGSVGIDRTGQEPTRPSKLDGVWSRDNERVYSLENLSVLVGYLQLGLAGVEFPRTTHSGPSDVAIIVATTQTRALGEFPGREIFPFPVNWRVWHNIVVPVFNNPQWKLSNGYSRITLGLSQPSSVMGDLKAYFQDLHGALRSQAQSLGIIPPPNKGQNSIDYHGLYLTNGIPEKRCCCPEDRPNCCGD